MVTTEASKTAEDTCEHMDSWAHLMGRKMSHSSVNKQLLMQLSRVKFQVLLQAPGTNCTRDRSHSTNGETVPELLRNGVPCDVAKVGLKCGISTSGLSILTKKTIVTKSHQGEIPSVCSLSSRSGTHISLSQHSRAQETPLPASRRLIVLAVHSTKTYITDTTLLICIYIVQWHGKALKPHSLLGLIFRDVS